MIRNRLPWIIALALAVRCAMIVWFLSGAHITPQVYLSKQYFQEGYAIAAGWGYATDSTDPSFTKLNPSQRAIERGDTIPVRVARPSDFYGETLHPPGMSVLVAAVHRLFGGDGVIAMMVIGALLDTAAAGILYLMIASAWSEGVAFIAAVTYALFLPQAFASTADLLPNGLVSFFVIAGFACVLRAVTRNGVRSYLWFTLAGLIFGLGGYLRPDYDLLAVGLLPFLWLYTRRFWRSASAAALMLAVTCVTLLPWAQRNHQVYGRWTFTSSAVGSTLVEGLGEFSNPWGVGYSDEWLVEQAKAHGFKSAWTIEADNYFNQLFLRDIKQHPAAYVATIGKRIPLTLAPAHLFGFVNPLKTKTFTEQRRSGVDRYQAILRNPLYVIAAYWDALLFAILSFSFLLCSLYMVWSERKRFGLVALLMAPHVYGIATHLLSDAEPRYLLPSTFSLMIGFGYCVHAARARILKHAPAWSRAFVGSNVATR